MDLCKDTLLEIEEEKSRRVLNRCPNWQLVMKLASSAHQFFLHLLVERRHLLVLGEPPRVLHLRLVPLTQAPHPRFLWRLDSAELKWINTFRQE